MDEKLLPPGEEAVVPRQPGVPSPKAQQWGVLISIVVIVLMVVIGAFYAWGQRIAEQNALLAPAVSNN
jgi:hypothetical protein